MDRYTDPIYATHTGVIMTRYLKAIENYKRIDSKDGLSATCYNLAEVYLRKKNKDSALLFAQKGLEFGLVVESKARTIEAFHMFSEIFESFNMPDSVLSYYKLYNQLNNTILTSNQHATPFHEY